jgi:hypothetical protein
VTTKVDRQGRFKVSLPPGRYAVLQVPLFLSTVRLKPRSLVVTSGTLVGLRLKGIGQFVY